MFVPIALWFSFIKSHDYYAKNWIYILVGIYFISANSIILHYSYSRYILINPFNIYLWGLCWIHTCNIRIKLSDLDFKKRNKDKKLSKGLFECKSLSTIYTICFLKGTFCLLLLLYLSSHLPLYNFLFFISSLIISYF